MQTVCQGEMPEMVDRKLHLPAFGGVFKFGKCHYSGVVDENVPCTFPSSDKFGDRFAVGKIELGDTYMTISGRR